MGHYISAKEVYKVKFRPGYEKTDFENWWMQQTPYKRDHSGCQGITVKVDPSGNGSAVLRYKDFMWCYPWDGKKKSFDHCD